MYHVNWGIKIIVSKQEGRRVEKTVSLKTDRLTDRWTDKKGGA